MSRRKQLKPQPIKGETGEIDEQENEPTIKMRKICPVKSETFSDTEDNEISSSERFDCQLCDEWFQTIADLQTHTIKQHVPIASSSTETSASLECQQCNSSFPSLSSFALHMRTHLSPESNEVEKPIIRCNICGIIVPNHAARLSHLVSHFEMNVTRRKCNDCGVIATTPNSLAQHNSDRHLRMQYLCTICAHISESQKEFREHSMTHSQEIYSFECNVCRLGFDSHELLCIHVQLVHDRDVGLYSSSPTVSPLQEIGKETQRSEKEIRILNCSVCDERCVGEDGLDEHRLFSHCKVPHSENCADCSEPLRCEEDFLYHTRLHARDLYMNCAVCRQSLRSESQLTLHCSFHMSGQMNTKKEASVEQQCNICFKILVSREQLLVHVLEHDARRTCPHCDKSFLLAHQLLAHVTELHPNEDPIYKCEICGDSFQFLVQCEHHKLSHKSNRESPDESAADYSNTSFPCAVCSKVFNSIASMQAHATSHHETFIKRCPICALSFNTISRYENHLKKHENARSCACQICGDSFTRKEDLELHMKIHKGNLELGGQTHF